MKSLNKDTIGQYALIYVICNPNSYTDKNLTEKHDKELCLIIITCLNL